MSGYLELTLGLAIGGGILGLAWRQSSPLRRIAIPAALTLIFLSGLDFLLLSLLPVLGLSYGTGTLFWKALLGLRSLLFLSWAGVTGWGVYRHRPLRPADFWGGLVLLAGANLFLSVGLWYGLYIEPFQLTVTSLEVPAATAPAARVRIVHLTDIHVERTTVREQALIPLVNDLEPDLILMTGDYLNLSYLEDPQAVEDLRTLLSRLKARYGIYAVDGTVEEPERLRELVAGLNVTVLDNEVKGVTISGSELYLVGVSNRDRWGTPTIEAHDLPAFKQLIAGVPPEAFSVLLYHSPDLVDVAAENGVDLYLAGHMHGGQVRLPFYGAVVAPSLYGKQYEQGAYRVAGTRLYVSRGIGMEGSVTPRIRLLAPPEVAVIDMAATADTAW